MRKTRIGGPRSRQERSRRAFEATGWTHREVHIRILKHTYPDQGEIAPYAKLAYDRGWITLYEFLQIPLLPGGDIFQLLYRDNPLIKLIKKERATSAG